MQGSNIIDLYYEVVEEGADPIVEYICPKKIGVGIRKSKMIDDVSTTFKSTHSHLRVMRVESVGSAALFLTRPSNNGMVALQSYQLDGLFNMHGRLGIPIRSTVALLGDVLGIDFGDLCKAAGVNRNYLNNTLKGVHAPSENFRAIVTKTLGVDPWNYAEWNELTVEDEEFIEILR